MRESVPPRRGRPANVYEGKLYGVPWFTDSGLLYYRHRPARGGRLQRSADHLGRAQGDGREGPARRRDQARLRLHRRRVRGRHRARARVHPDRRRRRARRRQSRHRQPRGDQRADDPAGARRKTGSRRRRSASFKEDEASGAFLRGDAVFMRMWPYAYDCSATPRSPSSSRPGRARAACPSRQRTSSPSTSAAGSTSTSTPTAADQDAAWELIEFLTAPEQQKQLALEASLLPTRAESTTTRRYRALPAVGSARRRSCRRPRRPSRRTTRTCRWRWRSSSTPTSSARRAPAGRREPPGAAWRDRRAGRLTGDLAVSLALVTGGRSDTGRSAASTYEGTERTGARGRRRLGVGAASASGARARPGPRSGSRCAGWPARPRWCCATPS